MELYVILRRSGWQSGAELEQAAARSARVGDDEMPDEVRWIRSYVLEEGGGTVGTVCIYEAVSPEALRKHASLAALPVDEIIAVAEPDSLGEPQRDQALPQHMFHRLAEAEVDAERECGDEFRQAKL